MFNSKLKGKKLNIYNAIINAMKITINQTKTVIPTALELTNFEVNFLKVLSKGYKGIQDEEEAFHMYTTNLVKEGIEVHLYALLKRTPKKDIEKTKEYLIKLFGDIDVETSKINN